MCIFFFMTGCSEEQHIPVKDLRGVSGGELKANANKSNVMVIGKGNSWCENMLDDEKLKGVRYFKHNILGVFTLKIEKWTLSS